jgi:DNA ligase-1
MIKTFPVLYKKSSKGQIQEWSILVENAEITVVHGLQDGKKQTDRKTVKRGKNKGKANETTPEMQAVLNAESKWKKQLDKGYVEDLKAVDDVVYLPMLAQTFSKVQDGKEKGRKKYIEYPCVVQRKFDGVRCLASVNKKGEVILESRRGKQFPHLEHLFSQVKSMCNGRHIILDGELYSDEMPFQCLVGLVKKKTLKDQDKEDMKKVKMRIYDCILKRNMDAGFESRYNTLEQILGQWNGQLQDLILTENFEISDEDEIKALHDQFVQEGYEGLILRNKNGVYALNKRSNDLQKYKAFQDDEFEIVGVEEGVGRAEGSAILVCKTHEGKIFKARPEGNEEYRRRLWNKRDELPSKKVTVRYFEMTDDQIPRFPIAKCLRDYE